MGTFGTTDIPSDQITAQSGGTVEFSATISRVLALVGGMDTGNGSATDDGTEVVIGSSSEAQTEFGENSELKELVDLALAQSDPPAEIRCYPVAETSVTAEGVTQSDTVDNVPVFDPNIHDEHSVTAADTGGTDPTVNIVYDSPPSTPSGTDEANFNPVTGEIEFDAAAAGSYEVDYSYGDYDTAVQNAVEAVPRTVFVGTENTSVANDLLTEMGNVEGDFDFMHGMVGAMPETDSSSYTDSFDDRRLSVIAPARGWTDDAETNEVRIGGAAAGAQAGSPLGDSTTYESLGGLASLRTDYTNSELSDLIDAEVYPVKHGDRIFTVKDMTTSTDTRFERIYASEIIDQAVSISHSINEQFIGELNTESNRFALGESHISSYDEMVDDDLLDAASVTVSEGANADEVDVSVGLDVVDVMDLIDVTISVGDVITFEGTA